MEKLAKYEIDGDIIDNEELKRDLDKIDKRVYDTAYSGYYQSRLAVLIGMWEKGKLISEFKKAKYEK